MPPIVRSAVKGKKSTASVRLDPVTRGKLRLYSRYAGVKTEEVIKGALEHLFEVDVDFGPYYEEHKEELSGSSRKNAGRASLSGPISSGVPAEIEHEESASATAA